MSFSRDTGLGVQKMENLKLVSEDDLDDALSQALDIGENTKVQCKICRDIYTYNHIEFHAVGVHGLYGPKEMYIEEILEMEDQML